MLNLQQKRWLVMNKDSQPENHMKGYSNNLRVNESQPELYREFEKLKLEIVEEGQLNEMKEQDDLEDRIRQVQKQCPETKELIESIGKGVAPDYCIDDQGTVWLKDRIGVPQDEEIKNMILTEAHNAKTSIYLGCTKT
jgi:hypothetical protein